MALPSLLPWVGVGVGVGHLSQWPVIFMFLRHILRKVSQYSVFHRRDSIRTATVSHSGWYAAFLWAQEAIPLPNICNIRQNINQVSLQEKKRPLLLHRGAKWYFGTVGHWLALINRSKTQKHHLSQVNVFEFAVVMLNFCILRVCSREYAPPPFSN